MANINYSFDGEYDAPDENNDPAKLYHNDKTVNFPAAVEDSTSGAEISSTISKSIDNPEVTAINGDTDQGGRLANVRSSLYRHRGLLFAFVCALFYSVEDVLMDILAEDLNVFQIPFMGASINSVLSGTILIVRHIERPRGIYKWMSLVVSGFLVAVGYPTALLSLKYMDVGASVAIIYTMPLFAAIFGWIILKEALKIIHVLFLLFSFGGVILIAQPEAIFGDGSNEMEESENLVLGTIYGLLSAITFALVIVVSRKQTIMGINVFVIMFSNTVITAAFNALVCTIMQGWSKPSRANWFEVFGYSLVHFVANMTIILALMVETAVLVSIASTSEVIFAFLFQIIIFHDYPDWLTVTGTILIIASCIGIALNSPKQVSQDTADVESENPVECQDNMTILVDPPHNGREVKIGANGMVIHETNIDIANSGSDNLKETAEEEKTGPNGGEIQECDTSTVAGGDIAKSDVCHDYVTTSLENIPNGSEMKTGTNGMVTHERDIDTTNSAGDNIAKIEQEQKTVLKDGVKQDCDIDTVSSGNDDVIAKDNEG